jgi:NDP-sugar pyrophosphorylase family protein
MGTSSFFKDSYFPKPLYEIKGKTMMELVVDDYSKLEPKQYIFVFLEEDCLKFHLDSSVKMLTSVSNVIKLRNQTAGALCTCLMAVEYINDDTALIIANSDQIIDVDYRAVIRHFDEENDDAGIITFPNIHPRWSYARKNGNEIIEVAEKRPISKNAIAGFYYFKRGCDFVKAAKQALIKQNNYDGRYYISAAINEVILMGKKVGYYDIEKEQYRSFYSPIKIKEYEEGLR